MLSVDIQYFALLRDKAGVDSESLKICNQSYLDLYKMLSDKYKFNLPHTMIQLAVNDEFTNINEEVQNGAKIVFIPPVAGG